MRGMEIEWWRPEDEVRGTETVLRGLERIFHIRRLQRSFCGAHGVSSPPPKFYTTTFLRKPFPTHLHFIILKILTTGALLIKLRNLQY